MPEQNVNPTPINEARTRNRHQYTYCALFLAALVISGRLFWAYCSLSPLGVYYLHDYLFASAAAADKRTDLAFAEVLDHGRVLLAMPPDVAQVPGSSILTQREKALTLSPRAESLGRGPLRFRRMVLPASYFVGLLRQYIYAGQSAADLFAPLKTFGIFVFVVFLAAGAILDKKNNRKREVGIIRRGPKLLDRDQFNRTLKSDGVGFRVEGSPTWRERLFAPRWRRGIIRVPQKIETSHLLVVGATGTGKSQLLVQLMDQIQRRDETAVVYDPDGEFLSEFYSADRGDIVLNPLDRRSPYWQPARELASNEEALTLAAALFPDPSRPEEKNTFFVRAPRQILARLFEYDPTPQELCAWLASKHEVDDRIRHTEMEEMLSKAAGPQRSGILASLSMALNAFRLLPRREDCDREWSARQWAEDRKGWIFISSRETTRDIQRPLMSMWLDSLLLRLMTKADEGALPTPVWLIIDELASLNKLPSLQGALTRARKYGIKVVLGYQQISQLREIYGDEGAKTITGNPATKIYFRTGDADTAKDVSENIGDQEVTREKINNTHSSGAVHGRTSKSYTVENKIERAVSQSQIQGLRDLNGFIRIYDCIARFILRYQHRTAKVKPFEPRNTDGFIPIAAPEPYELREPASDPGATVSGSRPSDSGRPEAPTRAGGGGGNAIVLLLRTTEHEATQMPGAPDQREPLLVPLPETTLGRLAQAQAVAINQGTFAPFGDRGQSQSAATGANVGDADVTRLLSADGETSSSKELERIGMALEADLHKSIPDLSQSSSINTRLQSQEALSHDDGLGVEAVE